jgi:hypothetical protein
MTGHGPGLTRPLTGVRVVASIPIGPAACPVEVKSLRFVIKPVDGGATILDTEHQGRVVALCQEMDEAIAIMAFLNGDVDIGERLHAEFLGRLTHRKH